MSAMPHLPADANDDGKYRIASRVEIVAILRDLLKGGELVTAYFNGGRDFVVTAVLEVDTERGFAVLDSGANPQLNERLLASAQISATASQHGVRIQFKAGPIQAVTFEGRAAFRVPIPDSLVKLQRREFYRMPTPLTRPVKCELPAKDGGRAQVVIADISVGGVCLMGEPQGISLDLGQTLPGCRILLPDMGVVTTDLVVRNSYTVTLKNGAASRRTGCEFVRLGAQQEAMVQRYIMKLDRERRGNK
jgi:c-di-GMP-binding flagellar brake protein YcgR